MNTIPQYRAAGSFVMYLRVTQFRNRVRQLNIEHGFTIGIPDLN